MDRNIELLKKKDEELTEALEKMENQSENNDIDDVIVPTAPLYKQILNLYAEENAIEDTIFYLGEALRRGVIDLEVFLKVGPHFSFVFIHPLALFVFVYFISCSSIVSIFPGVTFYCVFVCSSMSACCPGSSSSCERLCRRLGRLLDSATFTDPPAVRTPFLSVCILFPKHLCNPSPPTYKTLDKLRYTTVLLNSPI